MQQNLNLQKGDNMAETKIPYRTKGSIMIVHTNPGSRMMDDYEFQINEETGKKELVKTGEHDIYPEIQSYLEDTLIENIVTRVTMGDAQALEARKTQYIDMTDMPVSLMDAQNKILKIEREFNNLPLEERKKFDMSVEQYISQYGTNEWAEKIGLLKKGVDQNEQRNGNALQPGSETGSEEK